MHKKNQSFWDIYRIYSMIKLLGSVNVMFKRLTRREKTIIIVLTKCKCVSNQFV